MALIVFGSALTSTTPGDIDVAYQGVFGPREENIVRQWAAERGLPAELPIDAHRVSDGGLVCLPTPYSVKLSYKVIEGKVKVSEQRRTGVASAIRAFGHDADRLRKELTVLLSPGYAPRLTLVSARESRNNFDDYVEGITALRSAVAKATVWEEVWPHVPFGSLLDRLVREEPQLDPELLADWRAWSPWASQGDIIVVLATGTERKLGGLVRRPTYWVGPQYGRRYTVEDFEEIIFPK